MPNSEAFGSSEPPESHGWLRDEVAREIEVRESIRLVEGRVWDVQRDRLSYAGDELVRDYVDHTGAVGVLALDEHDRVLLIQQYRHAIAAREWEIPAGLMDAPHESGLETAKRELAEEADLTAETWHVLTELYTTPGGSSETIRVFLARNLSTLEHDYVRTGEESDMRVEWVPLEDAVTAVLERRIQNGVLIAAVLAAHAAQQRNWLTLAHANEPWTRRDWVRGERSGGAIS